MLKVQQATNRVDNQLEETVLTVALPRQLKSGSDVVVHGSLTGASFSATLLSKLDTGSLRVQLAADAHFEAAHYGLGGKLLAMERGSWRQIADQSAAVEDVASSHQGPVKRLPCVFALRFGVGARCYEIGCTSSESDHAETTLARFVHRDTFKQYSQLLLRGYADFREIECRSEDTSLYYKCFFDPVYTQSHPWSGRRQNLWRCRLSLPRVERPLASVAPAAEESLVTVQLSVSLEDTENSVGAPPSVSQQLLLKVKVSINDENDQVEGETHGIATGEPVATGSHLPIEGNEEPDVKDLTQLAIEHEDPELDETEPEIQPRLASSTDREKPVGEGQPVEAERQSVEESLGLGHPERCDASSNSGDLLSPPNEQSDELPAAYKEQQQQQLQQEDLEAVELKKSNEPNKATNDASLSIEQLMSPPTVSLRSSQSYEDDLSPVGALPQPAPAPARQSRRTAPTITPFVCRAERAATPDSLPGQSQNFSSSVLGTGQRDSDDEDSISLDQEAELMMAVESYLSTAVHPKYYNDNLAMERSEPDDQANGQSLVSLSIELDANEAEEFEDLVRQNRLHDVNNVSKSLLARNDPGDQSEENAKTLCQLAETLVDEAIEEAVHRQQSESEADVAVQDAQWKRPSENLAETLQSEVRQELQLQEQLQQHLPDRQNKLSSFEPETYDGDLTPAKHQKTGFSNAHELEEVNFENTSLSTELGPQVENRDETLATSGAVRNESDGEAGSHDQFLEEPLLEAINYEQSALHSASNAFTKETRNLKNEAEYQNVSLSTELDKPAETREETLATSSLVGPDSDRPVKDSQLSQTSEPPLILRDEPATQKNPFLTVQDSPEDVREDTKTEQSQEASQQSVMTAAPQPTDLKPQQIALSNEFDTHANSQQCESDELKDEEHQDSSLSMELTPPEEIIKKILEDFHLGQSIAQTGFKQQNEAEEAKLTHVRHHLTAPSEEVDTYSKIETENATKSTEFDEPAQASDETLEASIYVSAEVSPESPDKHAETKDDDRVEPAVNKTVAAKQLSEQEQPEGVSYDSTSLSIELDSAFSSSALDQAILTLDNDRNEPLKLESKHLESNTSNPIKETDEHENEKVQDVSISQSAKQDQADEAREQSLKATMSSDEEKSALSAQANELAPVRVVDIVKQKALEQPTAEMLAQELSPVKHQLSVALENPASPSNVGEELGQKEIHHNSNILDEPITSSVKQEELENQPSKRFIEHELREDQPQLHPVPRNSSPSIERSEPRREAVARPETTERARTPPVLANFACRVERGSSRVGSPASSVQDVDNEVRQLTEPGSPKISKFSCRIYRNGALVEEAKASEAPPTPARASVCSSTSSEEQWDEISGRIVSVTRISEPEREKSQSLVHQPRRPPRRSHPVCQIGVANGNQVNIAWLPSLRHRQHALQSTGNGKGAAELEVVRQTLTAPYLSSVGFELTDRGCDVIVKQTYPSATDSG